MELAPLTFSIFLVLVATVAVDARRAHATPHSTKASRPPPMFIFGGSYVDTGNVSPKGSTWPSTNPWAKPYGETWPGAPTGRYSNGHVLTDAIVEVLNMSVPTPMKLAMQHPRKSHGVNFASGGSGVLTTSGLMSSISSQINAFQSGVMPTYTPQDLASAIVLYCPSGDDYFFSLASRSSSFSSIYPLTVNVGKQISVDLIKLYGLGLRKFIVTYLPPIGCLPIASSENFYRNCNDTWTTNIALPHNARIFKNVLGLRHYFKNGTILLLDLFSAFSSAQSKIGHGSLQPCCMGQEKSKKCSSLGIGGTPAYTLCSNPNLQFYWDDTIHPSEAGWKLVVNQLKSTLVQIMK